MYRDYSELTENEKAELRFTLWDQSVNHDSHFDGTEYDYLSAEEQEVVDNADDPEDIPESVMLSAFGGICFVDEDFFCNL